MMGPVLRVRLVKSPAILHRVLERYIKGATQGKFPKQAKRSLPGMASSFRRYTSFLRTAVRGAIPSLGMRGYSSGSVFNNTDTFRNYDPLLGMCCFFFPIPHFVENAMCESFAEWFAGVAR